MSGLPDGDMSLVVARLCQVAEAYVQSGDIQWLVQIRRVASDADGPILVEYADSMAIWMRGERIRAEEARSSFEQGVLFGTSAMKDAKVNQFLVNTGNITGSTVGISESITNSKNMVAQMREGELKVLLDSLCDAVDKLDPALQAGQRADVAKDLGAFVRESEAATPRRRWLQLSAQGLIDAASAVGSIGTPVVNTVSKVLSLLKVGPFSETP